MKTVDFSETRPRYQVSVYITIGPLVDLCALVHDVEAIFHIP